MSPAPPAPPSTSFLHANRSQLKVLQQANRQRAATLAAQQSQPPFKMDRFKRVEGAVGRALERKREEVRGKEKRFLRKNEGKSVVKRGVNTDAGDRIEQEQRGGCTHRGEEAGSWAEEGEDEGEYAGQGEAGETEESIYAPTRSYPPSGTSLRPTPPLPLRREEEEKQAMSAAASPPSSARSSAFSSTSSSPSAKNFIAANALSVIHAPPLLPPSPSPPQPLHSAFGRVPPT